MEGCEEEKGFKVGKKEVLKYFWAITKSLNLWAAATSLAPIFC
jgi:hypothetical protein